MTNKSILYCLTLLFIFIAPLSAQEKEGEPLFTTDLALTTSGELVMAQKNARSLDIYSADGSKKLRSISLSQSPTGLTIRGDLAYVTTFEKEGKLEVVSLSTGKPEFSLNLGSGACAPILNAAGDTCYVCQQFEDSVAKIDLKSRKVAAEVKVVREPKHCLLSKDEKTLYVTNFLPNQRADLDIVTAVLSVVDDEKFTKTKDIELGNGSNAVRGMALSADGKYLFVTHNLGRFMVPTSQLQQGWMNTSAFSIIETGTQSYLCTILVDEPERGAAGVWDIQCMPEHLLITHSGTHELSIIELNPMLERAHAAEDKEALSYDLHLLHGIRQRVPLEGNGPRRMLLRGEEVIIPTYFADILNTVHVPTAKVESVNLNPKRSETDEQKGERYFNDAAYCFQNWQSCNGCHPGDARTDGLNWDLLNDGIGNSKNCKSLLFSHVTAPSMITGIRADAETAVRKGFTHIQFFQVDEERALCVDAYLKALRPLPSPYLVDGKLSEKAERGRVIYDELRCGFCHSGPYYTDRKKHVIGDDVEMEDGWDTPTLREVWRTAPYLFDGRARTMQEVFSIHKHGIRGKISPEEVEELSEYVLSL